MGASIGVRSQGAQSAHLPKSSRPARAMVRGTGVAGKRTHLSSLALPHRATARSSDVERKVRPSKPPTQNATADAAAQPDEFRVGNCAAVTKRSSQQAPKRATAPHSAPLPNSPSNGEVEGPDDHGRGRRGRTISQRPRRQTASASRTPPTMVRRPHCVGWRTVPWRPGSGRSRFLRRLAWSFAKMASLFP
jgi:hypothetical protein